MRLRSFRAVLDECLGAVQRGDSVEDCLRRYPKQADRLRPLLILAERIRRTPAVAPRPWAHSTAWELVRQRAAGLRSRRRRFHVSLNYGAWLRPAAVALSMVLALMTGAGATAFAAQSSLPDSPLYGVKLATEDVRLWFVLDESLKAAILLDQSDERIDEITTMVRQGKQVPDNVLSALRDRNERAAGIIADRPQETELRARILHQSESQEKLLIALWPDVEESARKGYTEAVAVLHNTRLSGAGALVSALRPEELSGGVLSISGLAQQISPGLWSVGGVGGVEVRVDERTIGSRELAPGATASFVVARSSSGSLQALSLSKIETNALPSGALVSGAVDEVTDQGVRVAGQWIPFTPDTLLKLNLKPGQRVEITLDSTTNGVVAAAVAPVQTTANAEETVVLSYEGTIQGGVSKTNEWNIGGLTFFITANTEVDAKAGDAVDGARALVEASLSPQGDLLAQRVTVLAATGDLESVNLVAVFQGTRSGLWTIGGLSVEPQRNAQRPDVGSLLAVEAERQDNVLVLTHFTVIQGPQDADLIKMRGTIGSISNNTWNLEIGQVRVASTAHVSGKPIQGARVIVWGDKGKDGAFQAVYARVLDDRSVASASQ